MKNNVSQGEILMLLAKRSGLSSADICAGLEISSSHLSRLYKSQILTENIKRRAARLFGVEQAAFSETEVSGYVAEPSVPYGTFATGNLSASEVLEYLKMKDEQHATERVMLLKIIDNLTLRK